MHTIGTNVHWCNQEVISLTIPISNTIFQAVVNRVNVFKGKGVGVF